MLPRAALRLVTVDGAPVAPPPPAPPRVAGATPAAGLPPPQVQGRAQGGMRDLLCRPLRAPRDGARGDGGLGDEGASDGGPGDGGPLNGVPLNGGPGGGALDDGRRDAAPGRGASSARRAEGARLAALRPAAARGGGGKAATAPRAAAARAAPARGDAGGDAGGDIGRNDARAGRLLPRPCIDGFALLPALAIHHDGDPGGVRLVADGAAGWILEIAAPGASYVSFAFSPDPAEVAPGPGRIWRASAALSLSPLPGAEEVSGLEHGWMRLNAAMPGRRPRAAVRDVGYAGGRAVRGFAPGALGVAEDGPPPEALWLDVILAAPRGLRVALRGVWLESALRPGI
ncbi:hypothetical protein ACQ5SO_09775 [Rhodovulum sp. DZ06]|uniref:hypothetical protein n=1 Tax=Rhodovulum sp. DZ06 TaxID=3425126 RepID=UPI003D32AB54